MKKNKEKNEEKIESMVEELKNLTKRECYEFVAVEDEPEITDSKVGGEPYLPVGEEYPVDKNGNAMPLFLQVNFNGVELENFPSSGILEVFLNKDIDYPLEYKVKFFEDTTLSCQTEFPEIDCSNFFVEEPFKIELKKAETYMPLADFRFDDIFCKLAKKYFDIDIDTALDFEDEAGIMLDKFLDKLYVDDGNIGGYANFTQEDPRTYDDIEDTTELFKVDTSLCDEKVMIGDYGIVWAFIKKEDLKSKHFENLSLDFDCC